ncbi:hypothetical protein [Bizionia arctica]|uniref:Uncharacterized protein n=1 Tax=Bizionia arctica TaxID=1495645 RepID=A0A917GFW4_9FLAO|nr:hypothetical protein [Bizionia arctica]GGG43558.1 hypothetical protein GCM10010976_13820 [Bizionia arctica]
MKNILFILFLLPVVSFSQKIKFKKDKIIFDDQEVAIFDSKSKTYNFSYLNGEKAFDAIFHGEEEFKIEGFQWVELINTDGIKTEIPYEITKVSFSAKSIMVRLLSEKYNLIDANGINKANVEAFFAEDRESLSEKYAGDIAEANANEALKKSIMNTYNPFVKDDGTILFGGFQSTNIVGHASFNDNVYTITDLDRITVAQTKKTSNTVTSVNVLTYSGDSFSYDYGSRTMLTGQFSRSFAQLLVEELLIKGYKLGREAKAHNTALHNEKVKVAKENSVNLYGVSGYVIDEDGTKYEGTIYAVFEQLELNPDQEEPNVYDATSIDNYGKNVSVKYLNDKGNSRIKKFTAKDKISFCAIDNGEEKCFYGLSTKGNAMKKIANATNFGFNNAYFYQVSNSVDGNMLLTKPGETGTYVLKFSDKEDGFMIDSRNNEKLSEALSEFISNCASLSEDIKNNEFDLSEIINLNQILEEYKACAN